MFDNNLPILTLSGNKVASIFRKIALVYLGLLVFNILSAQTFTRTELIANLDVPWEIIYGPDNYLWLTEKGGNISRVSPVNGSKQIIYTAPDYFDGAISENHPYCFQPSIGNGTLGMALHPNFQNSDSAFIYYMYSYNAGTIASPITNFKIRRIKWDSNSQTVIEELDIVLNIPSSYDHLGGRIMIIPQNGRNYLFLTIGDHGLSETNSPDCYPNQSLNPNVHAQDPNTMNGKIHRFNLDGSIPYDNPIPGNSFYTRGHRNPQGLIYNPLLNQIYSIEHGDRTDDEINLLIKGMNYGWKYARGYHDDNNFAGEKNFIANYEGNPQILNDSLVEAFYSWCDVSLSASSNNADWCTVAPSDGIFYDNTAIPQWYNSILVVTLKNGNNTDMELYQFKLTHDGHMAPSTPENPNPKKFFGDDQSLNGRLRDLCISPDGKKIYLINNGGTTSNKITVYTLDESSIIPFELNNSECLWLYPNPTNNLLSIMGLKNTQINSIKITDSSGSIIDAPLISETIIDVSNLASGIYFITIKFDQTECNLKFIKRN